MKFNEEQIRFLEKYLGIEHAALTGPLEEMDEDFLLEIGDRCFDLELEGDIADGSKMPDHCRIAADIYSLIND